MIKTLRRFILFSLFSIISLFLFLFGTTPGLKVISAYLEKNYPVTILSPSGNLLTDTSIKKLTISYQKRTITLKNLHLALSAKALLQGKIHLKSIYIRDFKTAFSLKPFLNNSINTQVYPIHFKNLHASLLLSNQIITIPSLSFIENSNHWQGKAKILLDDGFKTKISMSNKANLEDKIDIHGNQDNVYIDISLKPLKIKGNIKDAFKSGLSTITIQLEHFILNEALRFNTNHLTLKGNQNSFQLDLKNQIIFDNQQSYQLATNILGNQKKLTIKSQLKSHIGQLEFLSNMDIKDTPIIEGTIKTHHFNLPKPYEKYLNDINLSLSFYGKKAKTITQKIILHSLKAKLNEGPINAKGNLLDKVLKLEVNSPGNHLKLQGEIDNQLHASGFLSQYAIIAAPLNNLSGKISFDAIIKDNAIPNFSLFSKNLTYLFAKGEKISLNHLNLSGNYQNHAIKAKGSAMGYQKSNIDLAINISDFFPMLIEKAKLLVTADIKLNDLTWLSALIPNVTDTSGMLSGSCTISGTLFNPLIATKMQLSNGKATIPSLGIKATPISATLVGQQSDFSLNAKLYHQKNPLDVTGTGSFHLTDGLKANIAINGHDFRLIHLENMEVDISPKLTLLQNNRDTIVKGDIRIDKAMLKSIASSAEESLSDDVIIISGEQHNKPIYQNTFNYDLTITDLNNASINLYGLTGNLNGQLKLSGDLNNPPRASGSIQVENGKYQAYGQNLSVNTGKLIFSGGSIMSPGINLSASRQLNTFGFSEQENNNSLLQSSLNSGIQAGIKLTGLLKNPKVSFFSNQNNLSQSEIFSLLVLGKSTLGQGLDAADGKVLLGVLSNTTLGNQTANHNLFHDLQKFISLDDLSFESESSYDKENNTSSDETFMVLGKQLSPRLFVQYGVGFGDDNYLIRFKYWLGKRWLIQVENKTNANGFDLLYLYSAKP